MPVINFNATFNAYGQCVNASGNGKYYPEPGGRPAKPSSHPKVGIFNIYCEKPGSGRCWVKIDDSGTEKWCAIPWDNASIYTTSPPGIRDNYFAVSFSYDTGSKVLKVVQIVDGEGTTYPNPLCRTTPPVGYDNPVEWELLLGDEGDGGCCWMYVQGNWYCMPH